MKMSDYDEKKIWFETNNGGYEVSVIARLSGPGVANVQYILRLAGPNGDSIDYLTTLRGFKLLGRLLFALSKFATLKLYASSDSDVRWLKRLLTPRKIRELSRGFEKIARKRGPSFLRPDRFR
jgi:hypothetical protein